MNPSKTRRLAIPAIPANFKSNLSKNSGFSSLSTNNIDHTITTMPCSHPTSALNGELFENQLLGYNKAAQYLQVSESYLRRLKSKGKIRFVQVGNRGIRFKVASLNAWIAEREIG
ncbi:MAG: helix-turn-helix transcriptional regulator [Bdellovibrio sp.]